MYQIFEALRAWRIGVCRFQKRVLLTDNQIIGRSVNFFVVAKGK